jgi:hypothetical protein
MPKIKLKKILRIVLIIALVVALGLLISGVYLWRSVANRQPDMTSALNEPDIETLTAFLNRRTPGGANSEPSKAVDDLQLLFLGNDTEAFRVNAVMSSSASAMAELAQVSPGALQDILEGEITAEFPVIWPYVMAGSFIVLGNSLGNDPVVAFYNPYFDVAILTKWGLKDAAEYESEPGFKLKEAVPVTGRAFLENRPSLASDQPIWADSEALFEIRLVNAAQNFVAAFEERFPPLGRGSVEKLAQADASATKAAVSVTEDRVFTLLQWVIDARNPDAPVNYADAIEDLQTAFSASSPRRLKALLPDDNPQTADMFFELEPEVREGMKPYLVVDKNIIFVDSITLPTVFISVYVEQIDEEYVPGLVALFDLRATL